MSAPSNFWGEVLGSLTKLFYTYHYLFTLVSSLSSPEHFLYAIKGSPVFRVLPLPCHCSPVPSPSTSVPSRKLRMSQDLPFPGKIRYVRTRRYKNTVCGIDFFKVNYGMSFNLPFFLTLVLYRVQFLRRRTSLYHFMFAKPLTLLPKTNH